jgi:hypothetical protein
VSPTLKALVVFALVASVASVGCRRKHHDDDAKHPSSTNALDARIKEAGDAWKRYSPEDQALIKKGDTRVGLDELAVYIARGKPEMYWHSLVQGKTCSVLLYSFGADATNADTAITACDGTVTRKAAIDPPLPCWRLAEVAPRMVEASAYFDQLELTSQWKIVQGILERGLTGKDVRIAFGKPYSTGSEAREDKTDATTLVFLDRAQEAYGLNITLVDDKVVAWKIPAERILTPEAQDKRAKLAAKQAVDEARAQDQAAAQKHAEEAKLRNEVQARSTQFLMDVAASQAAQQGAAQASPPPMQINSSTKSSSQEKTLTLNGCTYHEAGGGSLGQSCQIGGAGCPKSYTCSIMGSGNSGMCVPAGQADACRKKH